MAIADLVLRYLQALVWPLAVLIIAVLFRGSIRAAVGRLTEVTGPGVSAKFETEAGALAAHAKEVADRQIAPSYPPYGPGSHTPWGTGYGPGSPYVPESRNGPAPWDVSPPLTFPPPQRESVPPPPEPTDETRAPEESPAGRVPINGPSESTPADDEDEDGTTEPTRDLRPPPRPEPPSPIPPSPEPPSARTAQYELRSRVRETFAAVRDTAEADPAGTVRAAWRKVADVVRSMTLTSPPENRLARMVIAGLKGTITPEIDDLLRRLDLMRDDVVADPEVVTAAAAHDYVSAAEDTVIALYRANGRTS